MLKARIIPCLLLKDLKLVKSIRFEQHRNIGSYIAAVRVFDARGVDELVFLDISATPEHRPISLEIVRTVAEDCFMPFGAGGGVRTIEDIRQLLKIGADKIVINTEAVRNPQFVAESAKMFGCQAIVVSIDARLNAADRHEVFVRGGKDSTGLDAIEWAKRAEQLGAGELLITSIDKDGTMEGYDIDLIRSITGAVRIPVIASGGAGKLQDFVDAVKLGGASAVAAASIFQYTQTTPLMIKKYMQQHDISVRL